jgi:hypothetical protein
LYFSEDPNAAALHLVCEVLYSSRENVNFVHEVYRQAFLLNFTHSPAIRKAIAVYKDWIQMNVSNESVRKDQRDFIDLEQSRVIEP